MDYWILLITFGDDVQSEARAQGCVDCMMDEYIEDRYREWQIAQAGILSFEDKVQYGNLEVLD